MNQATVQVIYIIIYQRTYCDISFQGFIHIRHYNFLIFTFSASYICRIFIRSLDHYLLLSLVGQIFIIPNLHVSTVTLPIRILPPKIIKIKLIKSAEFTTSSITDQICVTAALNCKIYFLHLFFSVYKYIN